MNYFEFLNPYYALIKANDKKEAVKKYIESVAGDESDFEVLLEDENGKLMDTEDIMVIFETDETELLVIDGSLI